MAAFSFCAMGVIPMPTSGFAPTVCVTGRTGMSPRFGAKRVVGRGSGTGRSIVAPVRTDQFDTPRRAANHPGECARKDCRKIGANLGVGLANGAAFCDVKMAKCGCVRGLGLSRMEEAKTRAGVHGVFERMPPVRSRFRTTALVLALCAGGYALAIAQPEAAKPTPPPAASEAKPPEPTTVPAPSGVLAPEEQSPLLVEPKTPVELFDAAVLTERLYRPTLARRYLAKLLQSNPSDEVLLDLRSKYGPAVFLQFSHNKELQPEGAQLLERVTAATKKQSEDTAYQDTLIRGLFGPPADRDSSTQMLMNLGPTAVPRILQHIGEPKQSEPAEVLVQTLTEMGERIAPVLFGAIESTNDAIRGGAIQALGLMRFKPAVVYLLEPAFDQKQPTGIREAAQRALARILGVPTDRGDGVSAHGAAAQLKKVAYDYLAGRVKWPTTDGTTELWTWNDESKTVVPHRISPSGASLYTGLRFARQALALAPEDRETQALFLALDLAWDAQGSKENSGVRVGPGTPHNLALTAGPDTVSATLALGLRLNDPSVALGALNAMASVGARQELYGSGSGHSPLLAALNYPNPDVQYAAAVAILRSNPDARFRGSERVIEILTRAISGNGAPVAVVIDANAMRGNETAGLFSALGFQAVTAFTGREGFEMAAGQSNVVLVAVHANVIRWPLSQTLSNLRGDARTANIPIVIYGPESVRGELEVALSRYPQVEYLVESVTPQNVQAQIGDYLKRALALVETPANRAGAWPTPCRGWLQLPAAIAPTFSRSRMRRAP